MLVAVGLLVAAWSVVQLLGLHADARAAEQRADALDAAAARTAGEVAHQHALLSDAELRLGDARRALLAADDGLDLASADHAGVVAELRATEAQLLALQEAVVGASGQAFANASLVGVLATCLDGLSELVNQLAVGDRAGAVRTVDRIGPACSAVGAAIQ